MIHKGLLNLSILLIFSIYTISAQRGQGNPALVTGLEHIRPYTGSGIAMSTVQYNNWLDYIDTDRTHIKGRKGLERSIHKKRHRKKELSYHFECVFHNRFYLPKGKCFPLYLT